MPTVTGRATDYITFTRASNATVTDSSGFIEWAGHNLLTNSESFDAAAWTKSSVTPTANSIAAPNGTTTADTLAASGANGTTLQTFTAEAISYTFGVWLKRKTGTGNIQIAADSGTYTTVTITSDWALYTVTQTPAAGSKSAGIRIVTSADEVYAWGAHLYRSDLGGMVLNPARGDAYYPTTPPNLLGYTESLTTGWTNSNTTDSIVTETNPNGLASSVEVTATAGNGTLLGSLSLLASPYTFSIYLKRKTGTGTVEITVDGTTYVAAAVTGTWTRFSTTLTPSAGTRTPGIRLVTSGDAVYAWGAQLSDSASLDTYSPVYGAAVTSAAYYAPRLDFDPVTLAAKGLLVEEQRTNLLTYSAQFDDAAWTKVNATISTNVTATAAPDGTNTADKLIEAATTSEHLISVSGIGIGQKTAAIYFKAAERTQAAIYFFNSTDGVLISYFDISGGTVISGPGVIAAVGNGWYRCSLTRTSTASDEIYFGPSVGGSTSYTGNGTSGVYIYGAQLEAGAFPTSYIPTGAATATRSADVASVSTQAFPYSASEGTMVVNAQIKTWAAADAAVLLTLDQANSSYTNFIEIYYVANGSYKSVIRAAGSDTFDETGASAVNNATVKMATAYKTNDSQFAVNGTANTTDTTVTLPSSSALIQLSIGRLDGLAYLNGHIRQITYLPRRLTSAELQTRTT